ncbi:MAG: glycine oxidase ThiO [Acidobacteriota bacterium]
MSPLPDVLIIGAGVIGCACAHELAQAGVRVHVLEARGVGQGASQASAGVLAPYIEGHERGPLRDLGARSLDRYDDFIQRLRSVSDHPFEYERTGTLEVARTAEETAKLRQTSDRLRADGVDARWLDPQELMDEEPSVARGASGGLLVGFHGFVAVQDFCDALVAAARAHGATFTFGTSVRSIHASNAQVRVETSTGSQTADRAVLAAGSWTGRITVSGAPAVTVKPVRGQLLHLDGPIPQPLRRVLWGTNCYLVPWQTGGVLVGATVEDVGYDERSTTAGVHGLLEAGCALVPHLWQASFTAARVGLRPASPDDLPIVGPSAAVPGLVYATGHYRNGVLLAPLTAALVSAMVVGDSADPALQVLAPSRLGW